MHSDLYASDAAAVDRALAGAVDALGRYRDADATTRADLLAAIAQELSEAADALVPMCVEETGLGEERLRGELAQTCRNLEGLAAWVRSGSERVVVQDAADPTFPGGTRPAMVRALVPIGVALNFAAGNFPFAFSVAGVDSAAALAVGCPVVVKAHPGHVATSRATADAVARATARVFGEDLALLCLIEGTDAGIQALRDPRISVATFTGSRAGGARLALEAAQRPRPIPFYGELGSINPVVLTAGALKERGAALADGYVDEVAFSGGQVCVKPGLLLVPERHGLDAAVRSRAAGVPEHRLLSPSIGAAYTQRRDDVLSVAGTRVLVEGSVRADDDGHVFATPTIVSVPLDVARAHADTLAEEVFGPLSVIVECDDVLGALTGLAEWVPGSLTASIHLSADERAEFAAPVRALQHLVGRIVVDEWPGAVYPTPSQHHGGPFPATTLDTTVATSVGPSGLARFQRAVAWQNAPGDLQP